MESTIRDWYQAANHLLDYLQQLKARGQHPIRSAISYFPDEQADVDFEKLVADLLLDRHETARFLIDSRDILLGRVGTLGSRFKDQIKSRLDDAICELGEWEGYLYGWGALQDLANSMRIWAHDLVRYFASNDVQVDGDWRGIQDDCPLDDSCVGRLRNRLKIECSRLVRDLKDHPAQTKLLPRPNGMMPKKPGETADWLEWENAICNYVDAFENGARACWNNHKVELLEEANVEDLAEFELIHKRIRGRPRPR